MKNNFCMGLVLLLILSGCAGRLQMIAESVTPALPVATSTPTATPELTFTPYPTAMPVYGASVAPDGRVYNTVYRSGNFEVRESYFGDADFPVFSFQDGFVMPALRITDRIPGVQIDIPWDYQECVDQIAASGWCATTVEKIAQDGSLIRYTLRSDTPVAGNFQLLRNGQVIWERDLNFTAWGVIKQAQYIGDDLAIEYYSDDGQDNYTHSIILTQGDQVVDIAEATGYDWTIAPHELLGMFAFFGVTWRGEEEYDIDLVINGEPIIQYDFVQDQLCCWDGPPVRVASNGRILDFFAQRNGSWYHVQAGDFSTQVP